MVRRGTRASRPFRRRVAGGIQNALPVVGEPSLEKPFEEGVCYLINPGDTNGDILSHVLCIYPQDGRTARFILDSRDCPPRPLDWKKNQRTGECGYSKQLFDRFSLTFLRESGLVSQSDVLFRRSRNERALSRLPHQDGPPFPPLPPPLHIVAHGTAIFQVGESRRFTSLTTPEPAKSMAPQPNSRLLVSEDQGDAHPCAFQLHRTTCSVRTVWYIFAGAVKGKDGGRGGGKYSCHAWP